MSGDGSSRDLQSVETLFRSIRDGWLQPVLAHAPVTLLVVDRDGIIQDIRRQRVTPTREEILGRSIFDFVDAAYHEVTRRALRRVLQTGEPVSFPSRAGGEGAMAFYENHIGPVFDGDEVVAVSILAIEVTRREEAEERRRAAEDRLRRLVGTMAEGFLVVDLDERITAANRAAHEICGMHGRELIGHSLLEMIPVGERHIVREQNLLRQAGHTTSFEHRIRRPDGTFRHLRIHATPVLDAEGRMIATEALCSDITERVEAQRSLEQREAQFRTLVENLPGAVYRSDPAPPWRKHLVSSGIEELTGYPVEEFLSGERSLWGLILEEDQTRVATAARLALESETSYDVEYRIRHAGGEVRWVQDRGQLIEEEGAPAFLDGVVLDITERRTVEEALRESEERFRTIVEESPAVTFAVDADGRFVLSEGRALANLGLEPGEAVGASVYEMYRSYPEILDAIDQALAGERTRRSVDVAGRSFEAFYGPRFGAEGRIRGVFGMAFDVTESRRLEQQLRTRQKMEAIGTLAGGVAHDFNNILLAMLGTAELALESLPEDSEQRQDLEEILQFGERATRLVRQVLGFSRPEHQVREDVAVVGIVEEVLHLARAALPTTIEIERDIRVGEVAVHASTSELHQILLNLVTNAGQAMEDQGGRLSLRVDRVNRPPDHLSLESEAVPSWVLLRVQDTGPGMSPDLQQRIFEPFFTTKEDYRGTGMGLAMVHSAVDSLGGGIDVVSAAGEGATFSIYLPEATSQPLPMPAALEEPAAEELSATPGRILVIDDETGIVKMLQRMITGLGYDVRAYSSATDALAAFESSPDEFDLVLSDQTMPDLTGLELTRRIRALRPELPILLMTGFSHSLTEQKARDAGAQRLLAKPIRRDDLDHILREALAES